MKKLLTTAALLTIGTAASFATSFTLEGYASDTLSEIEGTSVTNGRAAFSSITVGDYTFSDGEVLSGSDYSWSISFTVDNFTNQSSTEPATTQNAIFSVSSSSGSGSGYGIVAYEDSGVVYYSLTSDVSAHGSSGIIGSALEATTDATSVTISWDAVVGTLSLSVGESGSVSTDISDKSAASLTTYAGDGIVIGNTGDGSSVFWTNSGKNQFSNISLSVTEVPEPSMFGLLAGLGAIGLVAARRRRNRKA